MGGPFFFEDFMKKALKQAGLSLEKEEITIRAGIVVGGEKNISRGYNQTEKLNDVSAHAEMIALTSASSWLGGKYLKGCTMYVTIEPCPMCAAALAWAQIDTIVYGSPDPKKGYSLYSPTLLHPKTEVRKGVMEKECGDL